MASHYGLHRANFRKHLVGFSLLTLLLVVGCARLKQCAYEGFSRDQWQQPKRVIDSLQIRPGDHVADLGAGSGYFTFDLAKAVGPGGKIYAVDIDRDMTDLLTKRVKEEGAHNVDVILARPEDPLLPTAGVDLILSVDAYHHIDHRVSYFSNLRKYLRRDGRIGIVEFDRRAWLGGLWGHYTPSEFIKREMEQAGYVLQQEFDFLDRQSFLVFVPKHSPQKALDRQSADKSTWNTSRLKGSFGLKGDTV